jgi:4-hydroxy-4-methyl-2-oxoglutarate aldolase
MFHSRPSAPTYSPIPPEIPTCRDNPDRAPALIVETIGMATPIHQLTNDQLDAIRSLGTCAVANAIEAFNVRLKNEGYTWPGLRCLTGNLSPILGYAATCRVKSNDPPPVAVSYYDRTDWWDAIVQMPTPRVAVLQDIDLTPGHGASVGEVHASILKALGCEGVVTNGSVRDIPAAAAMRFPMFATGVSVSHSYIHMVDFGGEVDILGLAIRTGDLLYGDCHGVLSIPIEIAAEIPEAADKIARERKTIVDLCRSPEFSLAKLREQVQQLQP